MSFRRILTNTLQKSCKSSSFNNVAIRSFATYKTSTGLVGLAVDPECLNTVNELSQQVLESVKVCFLILKSYF